MGTRHLIAVQKDGRYGIAQYGQWDGYPSGQGIDVLAFCRNMDRDYFGHKVAATRFLTEQEIVHGWVEAGAPRGAELVSMDIADRHSKLYPHRSRDCGADVLSIVNDSESGIGLKNNIDFAGNSLFCEYAYVIDLDAGTLEVFRGFNKEVLGEGERFRNAPTEHAEYKPVKFWKSWPFDSLPSEEEFLAELRDSDEDE